MELYEKIHPEGWKDYPDTTTPIEGDKLTHIEEGIYENSVNIKKVNNVTKYITATAGAGGDFYIDIENDLATGMVLYISFPTPANVASNARLSVDGGSNYYNIQFSGDNLIGDNVKGKYLSLVFNGTIFEALGFKSYIVAVLTTNTTGVNNDPLKLPLQLKSKFGSKFSVSNGGILIGEGVKKIKVSAQTYVTTLGSTGIKKALVYNGSNSVQIDALANPTNGYVTISIPDVSIDVTPGNIIYLYCQGSLNDVWMGNGSVQYNRIYIEEII